MYEILNVGVVYGYIGQWCKCVYHRAVRVLLYCVWCSGMNNMMRMLSVWISDFMTD